MPSPETAHREPGQLRGVGLELGQPAGLGLLGDLGCDHVEDPAPEPGELLRAELGRLRDEVRLGLRDGRRRPRWEGNAAMARRITCACARVEALTHRRRQHRVLAVERRRQRQVGAGVGEPGAGLLRQPPRRVLRRRRHARSPASARTRNRSSTSAPPRGQARVNAVALSPVDMNVGFTDATPLSEARMSEAHATIGCVTTTASSRRLRQSHAGA